MWLNASQLDLAYNNITQLASGLSYSARFGGDHSYCVPFAKQQNATLSLKALNSLLKNLVCKQKAKPHSYI